MCKILIHVADTGDSPDDPAVNAARFHPGDVVDIFFDGHVFGDLDLGPHNKLIELPDIQPDEIEHLTGADILPGTQSDPGAQPLGQKNMAAKIVGTDTPDTHWRARIWTIPNYADIPATFSGDADAFLANAEMKPEVPVT